MNQKIKGFVRGLGPVYRGLSRVRQQLLGAYMRMAHGQGVSPKKVVFSTFKGASCSDSPLAIAQALHALRPDADVVFQLKKDAPAPDWIRRAEPGSPAWLREAATARVIVDNFNRPFFQRKFPDQKYIQTWHGDRGFKKVLWDMDPHGGFPDGEDMDLAVAGSDFCESMYRTAFRYSGEVLKVGLPRNDCLLHPLDQTQARRACGLPETGKIALYAPTFRDSARGGAFRPDFDLAWAAQALCQATGEDWKIVSRAHDQNTSVAGAVIDKTDFPEMSLLMQASDLLITDYSSCAGDFPLLMRPVILFHAPGRFERDLYFDVEASPFPIAHDPDQLRALFGQLDRAPENCRAILDFFGTHETGRSAEAVARRIAQWMDEA